jgi:hypothetical protein
MTAPYRPCGRWGRSSQVRALGRSPAAHGAARARCCASALRSKLNRHPLLDVAGTSREAVLSVLGRQGLRCLRSSCRAGRAAANERVTSAEMELEPLPPSLPNLRHVEFGSVYTVGGEAAERALCSTLGHAVAALPGSVVSIQMHTYGAPPVLAAIATRRGLQSLEFESNGQDCVGLLGAVARGRFLTSLTSLKLKVQRPWDPPPRLLRSVPWQQLQVSRAPLACTRQLPPRWAQACARPPRVRTRARACISRATACSSRPGGRMRASLACPSPTG